MSKPLTISEFATMGGKARWKKKSKAERKEAMAKVTQARLDKQARSVPNTKSA